ncbi:MAG TPA: 30S ribosomal protein S4 [Candidatus Syntrophosphaera sp.]|jgi:small subunit ribosomal protein S4|nr:30S ribosomal protein S4 [Candidatus Cloacimonadota bacterium]OQB92596.1 MAG: 30S ribosomal protein S4 [Candidatus Cloacimonetes bacterium ADurb.Bin117]HNU54239.1 30S ribosomal protein S4 [Candidatus Syntrophosphaera sp.]NLH93299.1 30S ribosomal protein S4 [Candidatus Cloacimonadota bacterium]HOH48583.1 30S ribosomal protein S4 [Candidatus Syntrophosphaera sp.]
MARYTGPRAKLCRKFGENIFGTAKYDRILNRRKFPPGQHGRNMRRKPSDYFIHLREKQKLRNIYCLLEKQFSNYFVKAAKMGGVTGDNLLQMLERRLDNTVYRLGFATTRMQARQFVNHGHFLVNGKKVDIPSYLLKDGDIIEVRPKSKGIKPLAEAWNNSEASSPFPWLTVDKENMRGQFVNIPLAAEIPNTVDLRLIVEFYSK